MAGHIAQAMKQTSREAPALQNGNSQSLTQDVAPNLSCLVQAKTIFEKTLAVCVVEKKRARGPGAVPGISPHAGSESSIYYV
jgi:hypothetical protein